MWGQKSGQILEKPCVCCRGHIFQPDTVVRMFVLIKSRTRLKLGHVGSKARSLRQILEKPFVHYSNTLEKWSECLS